MKASWKQGAFLSLHGIALRQHFFAHIIKTTTQLSNYNLL